MVRNRLKSKLSIDILMPVAYICKCEKNNQQPLCEKDKGISSWCPWFAMCTTWQASLWLQFFYSRIECHRYFPQSGDRFYMFYYMYYFWKEYITLFPSYLSVKRSDTGTKWDVSVGLGRHDHGRGSLLNYLPLHGVALLHVRAPRGHFPRGHDQLSCVWWTRGGSRRPPGWIGWPCGLGQWTGYCWSRPHQSSGSTPLQDVSICE